MGKHEFLTPKAIANRIKVCTLFEFLKNIYSNLLISFFFILKGEGSSKVEMVLSNVSKAMSGRKWLSGSLQ
jgi:hypothetical protein